MSHGKVKIRGTIVVETNCYVKIREPSFSFLYPLSFILPVPKKLDLSHMPLLGKPQGGRFFYLKR
jgi:hypothetical protein